MPKLPNHKAQIALRSIPGKTTEFCHRASTSSIRSDLLEFLKAMANARAARILHLNKLKN